MSANDAALQPHPALAGPGFMAARLHLVCKYAPTSWLAHRLSAIPQEMSMKLRPLHDRVIVKRLEQETKTASGIVIPDNAAEKPDQGEVLAVGPGKRNDKGDFVALNIKVGDRVLFGKYSGQTVKVDGEELLVMREEDLFAVVEK
jgi:chaperonin GroES